jgi:hypothetical protein
VKLTLTHELKGQARGSANPQGSEIAFALGGASPKVTVQSGRQARPTFWLGHLKATRAAALIRREERLLMAWAGLTLALPEAEI